jgi:hypothetical protein
MVMIPKATYSKLGRRAEVRAASLRAKTLFEWSVLPLPEWY